MKKYILVVLAFGLCGPLAQAQLGQRIVCKYKPGKVPDDDRGRLCDAYFFCRARGKVAFRFLDENQDLAKCCDERQLRCDAI